MNTYKKIVVLILLQSIVGYGIAQNCDFSKNETDKFTKNRVLHTKPVNVISKAIKLKDVYKIEKIEIQAKYENNHYGICVAFHFLGGSNAGAQKLVLLLSNGSIIEAPSISARSLMPRNWLGVICSYDFGISDDDFKQLLEYDIKDIRMESMVNPVDFYIDSKIKTTGLFNCINNNK